jgi:hypothetical protein
MLKMLRRLSHSRLLNKESVVRSSSAGEYKYVAPETVCTWNAGKLTGNPKSTGVIPKSNTILLLNSANMSLYPSFL